MTGRAAVSALQPGLYFVELRAKLFTLHDLLGPAAEIAQHIPFLDAIAALNKQRIETTLLTKRRLKRGESDNRQS
jgi:hypothetical protein